VTPITVSPPGYPAPMPSPLPRRIALPLAADTSDTRCGSCPSLEADWSTAANADRCTAFRKLVRFHGATAKDGYYERLPECRAAEVR
jgi:hypothetical protein